ncbi:MAG: hypothetical protein FJZ92_00320 [Chloroflexi bacterium]|nr:hypothetical protein [Chloroflexota bacterium]
MKTSVCPDCREQREQLTQFRDLYSRMRIAMGANSSTRALEERVNQIEVALFRHRCAVAAD